MKLETNLSNKDKKVIIGFLSLAVIFMFSWFLIRPAIISINDLNDDIEKAQILEQQNKNKIINLTSAEAIYDKAVNDLGDSTSDYYEVMTSSSIDRMITSYILSFGLFPEDLSIQMPQGPVSESPYIYSGISSGVAATPTPAPISTSTTPTTANSSADIANTSVESLLTPYTTARMQSTSTASSGVECAGLSLVMTGSRENCQALLDDICTNPSVRITSFEWLEMPMEEVIDPDDGHVEYVQPDQIRLRVNLNLYMIDVTDYEAAVNDAVRNASLATED